VPFIGAGGIRTNFNGGSFGDTVGAGGLLVRWLASNNAWAAGNGDYEAWEVGLVKEVDGWRVGAEAGWAEDSLSGLEGQSWLVGVSRDISHNVTLGFGWTAADTDIPVPTGLSLGHRNASNDGLLLELTVRN
jgi:hypothetical protein